MTIKSGIPRCDEASPASKIGYIACDAETDGKLYTNRRGEGPYHFCADCLPHCLRRGFSEMTPADKCNGDQCTECQDDPECHNLPTGVPDADA